MKIAGQIFTRKLESRSGGNAYLVCGIIKTNEPLEEEAIHTFTSDAVIHITESVKDVSRGQGLDGIMTSELWRVKL